MRGRSVQYPTSDVRPMDVASVASNRANLQGFARPDRERVAGIVVNWAGQSKSAMLIDWIWCRKRTHFQHRETMHDYPTRQPH